MRKRNPNCPCGRGLKRKQQQTCKLCHAEAAKRFRAEHIYVKRDGVAQLEERRPSKSDVAGSTPAPISTPELPIGKPDLEALVSGIMAKEDARPALDGLDVADVPLKAWQDLSDSLPPHGPSCSECDNPMRELKGKWACVDVSCGMYGREQRIRA